MVSLLVLAIMVLHYFTSVELKYHHAAYRMLFYLPLILGSFWFGLKGAIFTSAVIIIIYLPHMRDQWHGLSLEDFHNILEGVLFASVGVMLGLLVERERRKQRAFAQAESLAAVGRAVAEIAHDMKSPLVAIGGFAEQVAKTMGYEDPNRKKLDIIVEQAGRIEEMIRDMLEIEKDQSLKLSESNLNDIVLQAVAGAHPIAMKAKVLLGNELEKSLPHLMIDREKVERVVSNLIINAIQACGPEESVVIRTVRRKKRVTLEIMDNGCGVKLEHRRDLFTPFFSTKKEGTGLGLAIAKKIVDAHGGKVSFKPNAVKGTTFTVEFPFRA